MVAFVWDTLKNIKQRAFTVDCNKTKKIRRVESNGKKRHKITADKNTDSKFSDR